MARFDNILFGVISTIFLPGPFWGRPQRIDSASDPHHVQSVLSRELFLLRIVVESLSCSLHQRGAHVCTRQRDWRNARAHQGAVRGRSREAEAGGSGMRLFNVIASRFPFPLNYSAGKMPDIQISLLRSLSLSGCFFPAFHSGCFEWTSHDRQASVRTPQNS